MSNLAIRPVALKGTGTSNFRPFRLPAYVPAGGENLFTDKRMSVKKMAGSFSSKELPLSLSVGIASVGAVIFGMSIANPIPPQQPSVWKPLLIGGGLIGLGFAIYNLFNGPEVPPSGVQSSSDAAKTPTKEAFDQLTGSFRKPRMYENVDQPGPNWAFTANFFDIDVEYVLTNPTSEAVTVTLRLTQQEASGHLFEIPYLNVATKDSKNTKTYSKVVSVPPNTSIPVPFDVNTLNWTGTLTERLIMEKIRSGDPADKAVKLSEVTFYV